MLPLDRRREILQLCSEYDLILLEDDPYFYLQFQEAEARPPSLFSLDTEGRVIRFDSFSKILSSGIRLGFVTGPRPLIERVVLHMQVPALTITISGHQCCVMLTSAVPVLLLSIEVST